MKIATYRVYKEGSSTETEEVEVEYDENSPCHVCQEPVLSASQAGVHICPWCDIGKCRYCGVSSFLLKEEFDGGKSLKEWRFHMTWHNEHRKHKGPVAQR